MFSTVSVKDWREEVRVLYREYLKNAKAATSREIRYAMEPLEDEIIGRALMDEKVRWEQAPHAMDASERQFMAVVRYFTILFSLTHTGRRVAGFIYARASTHLVALSTAALIVLRLLSPDGGLALLYWRKS